MNSNRLLSQLDGPMIFTGPLPFLSRHGNGGPLLLDLEAPQMTRPENPL